MLKAIIFDFNGVILNDEPLHFASMRDAVAELGITITEEEYWRDYLPLDDWRCLQAICSRHAFEIADEQRERILARKLANYQKMLEGRFPLFPGAERLIRAASRHYPLAIASGARRIEIESALRATALDSCFTAVVAAEDFVRGKPHPESFLSALAQLNSRLGRLSPPIQPGTCLVIEDSIGGVNGARAAGMMCLAVSNSYPAESLQEADHVVSSLEEVDVAHLQSLAKERS